MRSQSWKMTGSAKGVEPLAAGGDPSGVLGRCLAGVGCACTAVRRVEGFSTRRVDNGNRRGAVVLICASQFSIAGFPNPPLIGGTSHAFSRMKTPTCRFLALALVCAAEFVFVAGAHADPTFTKYLPSASVDASYGNAVAASDKYILIGAPNDNNPTAKPAAITNCGAVYVLSATTRGLLRKLYAADGADMRNFGYSVAVDGDTAVVGCPDPFDGTHAAVYVYNLKTGQQTARLADVTTDGSGGFGSTVALSGKWLAVGRPSPGAVWVYDMTKLVAAPVPLINDTVYTYSGFGCSLAMSGEILVVGAVNQGDARVYNLKELASTQTPFLTLYGNAGGPADFGACVAVHGNTIVVGAPTERYGTFRGPGEVYLFNVTDGQRRLIISPTAAGNNRLGCAVAVQGNLVLAADESGSGTVYTYDATTGTLISTKPGADTAGFGQALAINRLGTAVIGAPNDPQLTGNTNGAAFVWTPLPMPLPGTFKAQIGLPAPGLAAPVKLSTVSSFQVDTDGKVLLQAALAGAPVGTTSALWTDRGGSLALMQRTGIDFQAGKKVTSLSAPLLRVPQNASFVTGLLDLVAFNAALVHEDSGTTHVLERRATISPTKTADSTHFGQNRPF